MILIRLLNNTFEPINHMVFVATRVLIALMIIPATGWAQWNSGWEYNSIGNLAVALPVLSFPLSVNPSLIQDNYVFTNVTEQYGMQDLRYGGVSIGYKPGNMGFALEVHTNNYDLFRSHRVLTGLAVQKGDLSFGVSGTFQSLRIVGYGEHQTMSTSAGVTVRFIEHISISAVIQDVTLLQWGTFQFVDDSRITTGVHVKVSDIMGFMGSLSMNNQGETIWGPGLAVQISHGLKLISSFQLPLYVWGIGLKVHLSGLEPNVGGNYHPYLGLSRSVGIGYRFNPR